jgi:hypothetical protein
MKIKLIILTLVLAACTLRVNAVTYAVNIDLADQPRLEEAFGSILGLKDAQGNPRPATTSEIEAALAQWMGGQTSDYEKRKNMAQFTPPPFESGTMKAATPAVRAAAPSPTPKKK